jgi:NADPH-dependent 2,4-dienoyl-CoA reductase/sulfur reductase-like enzyme
VYPKVQFFSFVELVLIMAPKLLIIGAGFAGLYVAKDAAKQGFDVTIVDPKVRPGKLLTLSETETRRCVRIKFEPVYPFRPLLAFDTGLL